MAQSEWRQEGRTTMHPVCPYFIIEQEVPEIAAHGKKGLMEFHVLRGGGDDSAAFSLAIFSTLAEAIADAERRAAEGKS